MAEWKTFWGSEEQLSEIKSAENGWIIRFNDGAESAVCSNDLNPKLIAIVPNYLICNPHPHAEMIKRWADTGQPVYIKNPDGKWAECDMSSQPFLCGAEYSFNPPKEKQFIEVRDYLYEAWAGDFRKRTAHKKFSDIEDPESAKGFVRWLDDDWRKVEI